MWVVEIAPEETVNCEHSLIWIFFLWRHFPYSSDLLFKFEDGSDCRMVSFSARQRWHCFDPGVYGLVLATMFQFIDGLYPASSFFQYDFDSSVTFWEYWQLVIHCTKLENLWLNHQHCMLYEVESNKNVYSARYVFINFNIWVSLIIGYHFIRFKHCKQS